MLRKFSMSKKSDSKPPAGQEPAEMNAPVQAQRAQDDGSAAAAAPPPSAVPPPAVAARDGGTSGTRKLRVRVLKAQGLVAKDKGGTSDPLAQLLLGSQKRETKVVPKTLRPEWNEEFTLEFTPGAGEQMDVVLYDHDKGLLSNSKEFLGAVTIHLDHILADMEFNQWLELEYNPKYQKKQEDVTGMVQLDISWSESEDDPGSAPGSSAIIPLRKSASVRPITALADVPEDESIEDNSRPETAAPKMRVIVTLLKAQGLVAKDKNGFSDPFAEVLLGAQKVATKHVPKTLDPEWDETFTLDMPNGEDSLEVVLYDHDKGLLSNSREYMGSCTVQLADIAPGTGSKRMWYPLVFDSRWNKKVELVTGQVEVEVEVFEDTGRPVGKWKDGGKSLSISTSHHSTCMVTIRVLRAEGLMAKDKGGTSDPFVELRIEKQKFKTAVIYKTVDPEWNETFSCDCDVAGTHLDVLVHDHDKGLLGSSSDYLGSVSIPLQFAHAGEEWYTLEWNSQHCKKPKETVTGRILLDIQGVDSGGLGTPGVGTPASLMRMKSSRLFDSGGTPNSVAATQAKVLEVTICKGAALMAKDRGGTSDPFVEARLGQQRFKTTVMKKTLTPEWNETYKFDYSSSTPVLTLIVYDEDKGFLGSTAEYMGSCDIPVEGLELDQPVDEWYNLKFDAKYQKEVEAVTGRLFVKLTMKMDNTAGVDINALKRPVRNERKALQNKDKGMGWLEVTVISAERITAADRGGTSDPYLELICGTKIERTKTKKKTLKPYWDEAFVFEVAPGVGGLELNLFDEDQIGSNTFLGSVILRLDDLPENEDLVQNFALQSRALNPEADPDKVSGSVKLLLNYFSKGELVVQIPAYDAEMGLAKYHATGRGSCTMCVICAVNLPLVDVKGGAPSVFVEVLAGESKTTTKAVTTGRCPVWNAPFLLDLAPEVQVCELVVKSKPSTLNVSKGDTVLGVANVLLADLVGELATSWHNLIPNKSSYGIKGSIKITTLPHLLPEMPLNYPRREVARIRENASKGLGTMELVVVGAKQLPRDPGTGTRTATATVNAGSRKGTIDSAETGVNPVWNKPLTLEIEPDVVSLKVDVRDKNASAAMHKFIGSVTVAFDAWPEGEEIDDWFELQDESGAPTKSMIRIWGCYVQKISYIDPAERGLTQGAIGDVEVVCIAARGVGIPQLQRRGANKPGTSASELSSPNTPGPNSPMTPAGKGKFWGSDVGGGGGVGSFSPMARQASSASFRSASANTAKDSGSEQDGADSRLVLEKDTQVRCEAKIGIMRRMTSVAKPAPNPVWNETLHLKVPHPTAVLEVSILVEEVGDVSPEPFATAEIALGDLKDGESVDSWYPLIAKVTRAPVLGNRGADIPGSPNVSFLSKRQPSVIGSPANKSFVSRSPSSPGADTLEEVIVGSVKLRLKVSRTYGFNLELLGGLVACPWRCGTSFAADDASAHFIICPLAPDPTAQVCCVHLALGCKFRGPRFGMKDHLQVCPYEPIKDVVRGYVKEIREMRLSLQQQDDEIGNLRAKIVELENNKQGRPLVGQEAHERYTQERENNKAPGEDPKAGAGIIDVENTIEAIQRKIIKWTPQHNSVTLEGHTDGVTCLSHSVEYKKVFSGSLDRTIRVWDLSFHEPLCDGELKGHRGGITGLACSKNRLVSGSTDMTLKVWDMATMREESKLQGHQGLIHGVIVLNEMCLSVSQDKSIKIWDLRSSEQITSLETKSRGQYGMAIHELKLLSASGSKIYSWDLRKVAASTMNEQQRMEFGRFDTLTGNASGVFGHQMVGDRLYTSAVDNSVRLWDLRSLQVKSKIVGHSDFVRALATAGERLITASDDKTIRVWDLEFHDCAKVLKGHTSYISALLCARARLFSASMDKTVRIWE